MRLQLPLEVLPLAARKPDPLVFYPLSLVYRREGTTLANRLATRHEYKQTCLYDGPTHALKQQSNK